MRMNPKALAAALALATTAICAARADLDDYGKSNLSKEPGAVYVEDTLKNPIVLYTKNPAPIWYQLSRERQIGTVPKGREVTIIALSDSMYRVRTRARHGDVSGWVRPVDLMDKKGNQEFAAELQTIYKRQKVVQEMIEKNEIALGMTVDEVTASIGKPNVKSSKLDGKGRQDIYEYVTYKKVPQRQPYRDAYGRLLTRIVYIKVETGRRTVTFSNDTVISIEQSEGEPGNDNGKIVVPPIDF